MTASVSVLFFLLIQTSFSEGKNTSRQEGRRGGGEGDTRAGTSVWVCVCDSCERTTYVYVFVQMWMYLCYSCARFPCASL